ncbi:MAG: hypothetical protein JWQ64_1317 [Subtercola sp.]|jgi:uncharacterized membrane protein YvlD (DUF360 family)|nr:hypothetical protein [Subtercola sp.]
MIKIKVWLIRAGVALAAACVGLVVAALLLHGVSLTWEGFLITVVVFAIAQSLLSPLILKLVSRNAPAFLGGIGIVSTLVSLIIASLFANGIKIDGLGTWVLATLIIWLITAIASFVLAKFFLPAVTKPRTKNAI